MSDYATAAYIVLQQLRADVVVKEPITTFRAFLMSTSGPGTSGTYKLVLGTDARHKDALWTLTDHLGEFFEIEIRRVRVHAPQPAIVTAQPDLNGVRGERVTGAAVT